MDHALSVGLNNKANLLCASYFIHFGLFLLVLTITLQGDVPVTILYMKKLRQERLLAEGHRDGW